MEYCKLQIGCLIIALYIGMIYMRERRIYNIKKRDKLSDLYIYVETYEQSSGKRKTGRKILDGSYIAVNYKRNHSRIVY